MGILVLLLLATPAVLSQQVEPGRLPPNAVPTNYDIESIIVLEPDFNFEGTFSIDLDITVGTEYDGSITFHSDRLTIDEASLNLVDQDTGSPYNVNSVSYQAEYDFVIVTYSNPGIDHRVTLSGSYSGSLGNPNFGLFLDSYVDFNTGETRYLAATMFAPNGARLAFPCLDEPDLKATFNFRIGRPSINNYRSVFNTRVISEGDEAVEGYSNYVWDVYETTPLISTYLISFGINDFTFEEAASSTSNGVSHRSLARKDTIDAGYAVYAVNTIEPPLLQYYEDTFGQPYPMSKMDQIAYPSYGGAMENWGLIVYAEDLLLWDSIQAGADDQEDVVAVIAHENAHNFFGDLVTCQWWDAVWLNEGFAEYVQYLGVEAVEPSFSYWDAFYFYEYQYVLTYDGTTSSHPTIQNVTNADDIDYGAITYDRGSSINRFLSSVLTRETFIRGLNTYLADNAFGAAQFDDLWQPLNEIGHSEGTLPPEYEIKDIMESYMVQMNYPLLTVNYDASTGLATLSQSRFLYDPENADPSDDYRWYVPFSYTFVGNGLTDFGDGGAPGTFQGAAHNTFFMTPDQLTLDVQLEANDLPLIANLQAAAYMRVNYDQDNWNRIINQLQTDFRSINAFNRQALLNDAFALAEAGIEGYDLPLNVAQYLLNEDEYAPMGVALDILQDLISSSNNDISAQALEDFLEGIIAGNYGIIGIEEESTNTHAENQFQRIIASGSNYLQLPEFDNDAGAVFTEWTNTADPDDPIQNPVNRHIKRYVYCAAARELGSSAAQFMQERLQNTVLPQEIDSLIYGISCVSSKTDAEVVASILDPILSHPYIPLREGPLKLFDISLERSFPATLAWLDLNFEDLKEVKGSTFLKKMIVALTETIYRRGGNRKIIQQVENLRANHELGRQADKFVEWAISGVKMHMKRTERFGQDIVEWAVKNLGKEYLLQIQTL